MQTWLKKLIVILPVIIVSLVYLPALYHRYYEEASFKRTTGLVLSILVLYAWIVFGAIRKKQSNFLQVLVQSSFFVYVFAVLQLTGYFILFKEVSSSGWWDNMNHRIATNDHVNSIAFKTIGIYSTFDKQVIGNFVMLFPLGMYLPLLFIRLRRFSGLFAVLLISFLVSLGIEVLQLATSYRSADIDDVILNTMGACFGYLIYQLLKTIVLIKKRAPEKASRLV